MSSDPIRAFRDEDIPAVARIWRELRPDAMHSENGLRHLVGAFPERAQAAFWVAEDDGRVVGFFALSDNFLYHLYVYPELHGQGAGSLLFDRVKELAPDGFRLWVFQRNTQAREFYEHRGMRVVELTDGSRNEEREPDALYEWLPSVGA